MSNFDKKSNRQKNKQLFMILMMSLVVVLFFSKFQKNVKIQKSEVESNSNNLESTSEVSKNLKDDPNNKNDLVAANQKTESPQTPAAARSGASAGDLRGYLLKQDPNADWRVNRTDDGRVVAISGGFIKEDLSTPEKYQQFAENVAAMIGIPQAQLVASETNLDGGENTAIKQFDQELGEYKVFGSYMKVFTRNADGSVFYIANEVKETGEVDLRIKYSFSEVAGIVMKRYEGKKGLQIENSPQKPMVYVLQPGQSELAWEIVLKVEGPLYDRRHIMISATSGNLLKDISLLKN